MIHSVYIHIPFCQNICSYCDFCKLFYNSKQVDSYLNSLKKEIISKYNNELINTIYIGGGTPSVLNIEQLKYLFEMVKIFKTNNLEYTIECNIESITEEKLILFKKNGINRISIGIQTLNDNYIKFLNRHHTKKMVKEKINLVKKYINNINIDLIYAIPGQTLEELGNDLDYILKLDVNHISAYSLIIEEHTKLYINKIKNISEDLDFKMYELICQKLAENNYIHYEISNFSKKGYESKHNLVYWNNERYYGFGMGASGYIDNIRYDNTRSLNKYLNGNYILNYHNLEIKETIENEFILGLRKIQGIDKEIFFKKYNIDICKYTNVKELLMNKKLIDDGKHLYINPKFIYTSNNILIDFLN